MGSNDGLIFAYIIDGEGGGTSVDWKGIKNWNPDMGILWIHIDYKNEEVKKWLHSESNLSLLSCEILIEEDTRPEASGSLGKRIQQDSWTAKMPQNTSSHSLPGTIPSITIAESIMLPRINASVLKRSNRFPAQSQFGQATKPQKRGESIHLCFDKLRDKHLQ